MGRRSILAIFTSLVASLMLAAPVVAASDHRRVEMLDACDGPSFNAVIGDGACIRKGGVTFDAFIGQLQSMGQAPAWRFTPGRLTVRAGGSVDAYNRGGEAHTFTEVAAFGGGCVDELNAVLGLSPVPECGDPALFGATLAPPGEEVEVEDLSPGRHLFQCLIHPWMRTTVDVS